MIETIKVIQIISSFLSVFFMALSMKIDEKERKIYKKLWYFFLLVTWICIFIRTGE